MIIRNVFSFTTFLNILVRVSETKQISLKYKGHNLKIFFIVFNELVSQNGEMLDCFQLDKLSRGINMTTKVSDLHDMWLTGYGYITACFLILNHCFVVRMI